jgi:outer membrane protein assembly factor BamB
MPIGKAPAVYNELVFFGTSPFTAHVGYDATGLWSANLFGTNFCYAAVGSDVVCIADINYDLYGLDIVTGAILWSFGEASVSTAESPVIANGLVYVDKIISQDVRCPLALDARTGAEAWAHDFDKRVESPMTVVDDLVLFCDNKGQMYALDAQTGEQRWQIEIGGPYSGLIAVADGIALLREDVVDFSNSSVNTRCRAVELSSGDTLWRSEDAGMGHYVSNAAVADGVVCLATDQGYLVALDLKTGKGVWHFDAGMVPRPRSGNFPDPAISNGIVYFGVNHVLYALDLTSGKEYWSYEFQGYDFEVVGSPVLGSGYLFVTFGDTRLYVITNRITRYYIVSGVDVHADPSTSSPTVAHLSRGTRLDTMGDEEQHDGSGWRRISVGDVAGWIESWTGDVSIRPVSYEDLIFTP